MINLTQQKEVFLSFPDNCFLLLPDYPKFTIIEVNRAFQKSSGMPREQLVGNGMLDVFGKVNTDHNFIEILSQFFQEAIESGEPNHIPQVRYDLPDKETGTLQRKIWEADNIPIKNEKGEIEFILHRVRDITQVINTREKGQVSLKSLQKNEKFLKETQEVAKIGSWELDVEQNSLYWSKMLKEIHEVPQDFTPILDTAINFYKSEKDKTTIRNAISMALNSGKGFDLEFEIITAKNNDKWIRTTGKPEFKNGRCIRIFGATQDITSRKLAQIRLENINDNIPGVVFRYKLKPNGDDQLMYISEGVRNVWGITPQEATRDNSVVWNLYHEDDIPQLKKKINESASNLSLWSHEWRVKHPGKGIRWNRGFGSPQKLADGSIVWDSIVLDVTEEKLAYELLEINESRQRSLLESQTNYVIRIDIEGNYTYCNNKYQEDFSWINGESRLIGESSMIAVVEKDRQKVEGILTKCLGNPDKSFQIEFGKLRGDGSVRTTVWDCIALSDAQGNPNEIQCTGIDISEKHEAELELNKTKEQYKGLIKSIEGVFWELDVDTFEFTFVSDQALDLIGIKPSDWYHKPKFWENHIHPDDRKYAVNFCLSQVEQGKNHSFEYRMLKADGSYVWVSDVVSVVKENGKPRWLRGIMTDVSKRKKTEKDLEQKRSRLDKIMNESLDIISIIDAEGYFTEINRAAESILGYSIEELRGKAFMNFVLKEDKEKTEQAALDIRNGTAMTNFENRYVAKNGNVIPLTWSAYWDSKENLMYAIARDSRERKRAEEQLKLSEQRFKSLVQEGGDLIALLDENGDYRYTSPNFISVSGYSPKDFENHNVFEFIHPDDLEEVQKKFEEIRRQKRVQINGIRFKHKNGSWRWLETTATNLIDDPAVKGIVTNSRDITEKRHFQELENLERKVLEMNFKKTSRLKGILNFYVKNLEKINPNASFVIQKLENEKLSHWASGEINPNLVDALNDLGIEQKDKIYSVFEDGKPVVLKINKAPASRLKTIALKNEIESCWTYPIIDSKGQRLGIFTVFYKNNPFHEKEKEQRSIKRSVGLLQLIVEFQLNEIALKRSNQRYEFVNKATEDAIYDWDVVNDELTWGDGFYKMLGTDREQGTFPLQKWSEGIHPNDIIEVNKSLEQSLKNKNKSKWHAEYLFRKADGSYLDIIENGYIIRNDEGKALRMIGVLRDVSDIKAYEKELESANERYRYVTKATSDAIWDYDVVEGKLFWGAGFETIFNYNLKEFKPNLSTWYNKIHPDDQGKIVNSFQRFLEGEDSIWEEEYRYRNAQGDYLDVFDRGFVVRDKNKKAIRVVGAIQDISRKKQYEISLKKLNAELKERAKELATSNAELEQFAYVASHDLQEPLRMVTSFLTQLEKKYADVLDEKGLLYIDFAVDGAKRMRQIILDLLEFSRVGRTEDKLEDVSIAEILEEITQLYRKRIEERKAKIISENLPVIKAPKSPIRQVFQNIISNALKYSKEDISPEISIDFKETENFWEFSIKDNGIGIDKEYFDRIFVIFQRLHHRDEYSGTGMGLAVTKKIIENLGGKIWVESQEEKGSIFHFTIAKAIA
ncbi:PAS domain-containing protein [Salegentibacter salegens]|uniref:histidine kinase n=1 Tax=Salegentibacter salegens TaxID=143223 RepID=A0A1M7IU24_9FLAO|nr:PAS domain-containing protein [Salegentibacter salegens]PRX49808.1 PAS domain S-box-containing protein [Salegentibacter salegens]SHM44302.1 PAS domain S-box-containing protein [Salegentibacter salegens]